MTLNFGIIGNAPGLFSGLGSQPKPSDAPTSSASPFGALPAGSLFAKTSGTGTTTTANTQPQPAFSLGGATSTGDKTASTAATASKCLAFLVSASAKHKGPQQVAGFLGTLVPLQTKMVSPRKRKTVRLVGLEVARFYFPTDDVSQQQPYPHSPLVGHPQAQQQPLRHPQQRERLLHVSGFSL